MTSFRTGVADAFTMALEGTADKNPAKAAHGVAFFRQGQDFFLYLAPHIKWIGHQPPVHLGSHHPGSVSVPNQLPETGGDNDAPLGVDGMKGASAKHFPVYDLHFYPLCSLFKSIFPRVSSKKRRRDSNIDNNFYVLNDRQAKTNPVKIVLVGPDMPVPDITDAEVVVAPTSRGVFLLRSLIMDEGKRDDLIKTHTMASCTLY